MCTISNGQGDVAETMLPELPWQKGRIVLNDGTQLQGMLKYNDRVGLLAYEDANGDSRSLTARSVASFEYVDEHVNRRRVFYSFDYYDSQRSGAKRPFMFELLQEFEEFAVLSRFDATNVRHVEAPVSFTSMPATGSPRTIIDLAETVYLLHPDGEIEPIFRLSDHISNSGIFESEKKKRKIVDRMLSPYFPDGPYAEMMAFVDREALDIWAKEDFIKALKHYNETARKTVDTAGLFDAVGYIPR
jgi:hypothetical protein